MHHGGSGLTGMSHSLFNATSRERHGRAPPGSVYPSEGVPKMPQNSSRAVGRHFLQIPGPTPLPEYPAAQNVSEAGPTARNAGTPEAA